MASIKQFNANDFSIEKIKTLKENKKLYVIFSTFGTREADLIYEKISYLKDKLGSVPVHFAGSIAFLSQEEIKEVADEMGFKVGNFVKRPIDGLVKYHTTQKIA